MSDDLPDWETADIIIILILAWIICGALVFASSRFFIDS
jgi:hypothetical protein